MMPPMDQIRMQAYLTPSAIIDFDHPAVAAQARALAAGGGGQLALVRRCFEFVRDQIHHSVDYMQNPVTLSASEVLQHGTGYCYAKSHLLAALLRANGVPTGLCYQRLSISDNDTGAPYCLHGLNAVYLDDFGWYRIDPRGNKPGVQADFCPPKEVLAFAIREAQERDLPEIWADPLPVVVTTLQRWPTVEAVLQNLPDIELLPARIA